METALALWMTLLLPPDEVKFNCDDIAYAPIPYYVQHGEVITATTVNVWHCVEMEKKPPRKKRSRRRR